MSNLEQNLAVLQPKNKSQTQESKSYNEVKHCAVPCCRKMKRILSHMTCCSTEELCLCSSSGVVMSHLKSCTETDCSAHLSLKQIMDKKQEISTSIPVDGNLLNVSANSNTESWECTTCYFQNFEDESNCIACETPKSKRMKNSDLEDLGQNLKDLHIDGKNSDLTIKVKDFEFKAHKDILKARSSVFDVMFSPDLSDCNTGSVLIVDCAPAIFKEFLCFIYTGKTQHLSSNTVCDLYYVADKYELAELKEECISFLKKSLTPEIVGDVFKLCAKHGETELLEFTIDFFARNMRDVLVTSKWMLFLRGNPVKSNGIVIKALEILKSISSDERSESETASD